MKKFFSWVFYILFVGWVAFALLCNAISLISKGNKYVDNPERYNVDQRYKIVRKTLRKFLWILRIKVVENNLKELPNNPSLLLFNHKSNIDGILLVDLFIYNRQKYNNNFKFCIIGKNEITKSKIIRSILNLIDTIYIDRNDLRQQVKVYEKQKELVDEKFSIGISPEGTRHPHHEILEFKPGALKIAFDKMMPIVPICIYGSTGLLDKDKTNKNKSRKVYISFLKPHKPLNFHLHNTSFLAEKIKNEVEEEYNRIKKCVENKTEVFVKS